MKLHKTTIAQLEAMASALGDYRKAEHERDEHRKTVLPDDASAEEKAAHNQRKSQLGSESQRTRELFLKAAMPCKSTIRQVVKIAKAAQAQEAGRS